MKFFSEKFLTDEHIKYLRNSRRIYAKDKIIKHGHNFVEVVNFEKRIKVFPENDELLKMIDSIERFSPEENILIHKDWEEYRNYRYEDLPIKLQRYMHSLDDYFFATWYNRLTKNDYVERYDRLEQRLLDLKGEVTDEDFEKYVLCGHPIPNTLGKKAKDSARRAYKQVNSYIKSNIHRFTQFVTLTFALEDNKQKYLRLNSERLPGEYDLQFDYVNAKDFELAKKALKNMMDTFKRKLKKKGIEFYYITVWELQKNGNYHFHILCSEVPDDEVFKIPKWLDYNFVSNKFNDGYGLSTWRFGKSDVQKIKSPEKVTTYVSKYILKSFLNYNEDSYLEYLNKKKFFPSKNLDKPSISYFDSDEHFDKELTSLMIDGVDPFEKVYKNPYNDGSITHKIYTRTNKKESISQIDSDTHTNSNVI